MIRRLLCSLGLMQPEAMPLVARSPDWPRVRKQHLRGEPRCQVCGKLDEVEVHHIEPVHVSPALELAPGNLITLCQPHHFLVGHLCSWFSWNAAVRLDAALWREKIRQRPEAS